MIIKITCKQEFCTGNDHSFVQIIMELFVNDNDGEPMKISFANNIYKQQMLINDLANDNYQYEIKSKII